MKTRGIMDLYLPKRIAKHVKFILFCAAFTPVWGLIIKAELDIDFLVNTFVLMCIVIEFVYLISQKILKLNLSPPQQAITWKDIIRKYLVRLVLFYLSAIAVGTIVVVSYVYISHLIRGNGFPPLTWVPEIALVPYF